MEDRVLARAGNVLSAGAHQHAFDDLGRVVQRDDVDLTYGPNGQIATARRAGRDWAYLYDEGDQRIAKLVAGDPVAAYLDDGAYLDDSARTVPVKFDGSVVGLLREPNGSPKTFALTVTDPRGSVLADADGTPRVPSPYGDRADHPDVAAAIDYATKGWDADLGTVRMGVRDYDPSLNRWLTADPLYLEDPTRCAQNPVSCSLYAYARNNPVLMTDPSGLDEQQNPLLLVAAAAATVLGFGMSAPSDTSQAPADLLGMVASVPGVGPAAGGALKALVGGVLEKALPSLAKALEEAAAARSAAAAANAAERVAGTEARVAATEASVTDKLSRYLLNTEHPVGRSNAAWFDRALAFNQSNGAALARQIVFDAGKAVQTGVTEYGTKFNQVIPITGANGRIIDVTFAWIRNNDGIVRLVTGIPTKQ